MIRKRAITFLGMALLVAFSGFATRAFAADSQPETDRQECVHDGGWYDGDIHYCEHEA